MSYAKYTLPNIIPEDIILSGKVALLCPCIDKDLERLFTIRPSLLAIASTNKSWLNYVKEKYSIASAARQSIELRFVDLSSCSPNYLADITGNSGYDVIIADSSSWGESHSLLSPCGRLLISENDSWFSIHMIFGG